MKNTEEAWRQDNQCNISGWPNRYGSAFGSAELAGSVRQN